MNTLKCIHSSKISLKNDKNRTAIAVRAHSFCSFKGHFPISCSNLRHPGHKASALQGDLVIVWAYTNKEGEGGIYFDSRLWLGHFFLETVMKM